jgi:hypothetical protein
MKPMWIWILIVIGGVGLLLAGCQATRAGYESAPYEVVRTDGEFELRDYPSLVLVETRMTNSGASDGSFSRLFGYISGANEGQEKISMTTPVFMSGSSNNSSMAFVMPAKMNTNTVPKPTDQTVKTREVAAGRFAVLGYSGGRNVKNEAESLARLQAWLEKEHLTSKSGPVYGYFDPPWTPGFMRRNEVMLRIDVEKEK